MAYTTEEKAEVLEYYFNKIGDQKPDDLLFSYNSLTPRDPSSIRRQFYKTLDKANLKHITMHSLRHSFATTLIGCGASIKAVQSALGHSSATMTLDTYSHLMSSDLGDAASRADALLSNTNENLIFISQEAKSIKKK
jgi:integrase